MESTSAHPDRIGPYRIQEIMGIGGMGVVYRAIHADSGKVVAVKTVSVPHSRKIEGLRREIRALARIDHPGVVTIYDEGIQEDSPWYAMELLEGVSLRKYNAEFVWGGSEISTAWNWECVDPSIWVRTPSASGFQFKTPVPFQETQEDIAINQNVIDDGAAQVEMKSPAAGGALVSVLTLLYRLCNTLAYLHGEGIIHGDLKPENILVRRDGMPVVLDFGLTTQLWADASREDLVAAPSIGGTLLYLAPEQIRGDLIDARADLYSLGCILYELVTGKPPFTGMTGGDLILAQLNLSPTPPVKLTVDLPWELNSLICGLLEKDIDRRIAHADDVAAVLGKFITIDPLTGSLPKPKPYLYRSRLTGRDRETSRLTAKITGLARNKGGFVVIRGESGIGKTRLLLHISGYARRQKITVLAGSCSMPARGDCSTPSDNGRLLEGLRRPLNMIADICIDAGREMTDQIVGSRGGVLAMYEPRFHGLPGQDAYPEPQDLPLHSARLRLFTYLADTLHQMASIKPLILILDDLQWADELTLGFLEFILRIGRLPNSPVLIIVTYRLEESTSGISRIIDHPGTDILNLDRLDSTAVSAMISDMLGISETRGAFCRYLTRFSAGNPFFVAEYLRTAVAEGHLYRGLDGTWQVAEESDRDATEKDFQALQLPHTLLDLIERRLSFLSAPAVNLLESAAVLGSEFDIEIIWNMVNYSVENLDSIDELIRRQILCEPSPGRMGFIHDRFREVIYRRIPNDRKKQLHLKTAMTLESMMLQNLIKLTPELACHWELAGESDRAAQCYLANARQSASVYALGEAEMSYLNCLKFMNVKDRSTIEVMLEYSDKVLVVQGRTLELISQAEQILDSASQIQAMDLYGAALICSSRGQLTLGNAQKALLLSRQAVELFTGTDSLKDLAGTLRCMAQVYYRMGHLHVAEQQFQESASLYRQLGMTVSEATALASLAPIYLEQGDRERAGQLLERCREIHETSGDRRALARSLGNLANFRKQNGDFTHARTLYHRALSILQEIGDRIAQGVIIGNLAGLCYAEGQIETAKDLLRQTLVIHRETLNRAEEGIALSNLAGILMETGSVEESVRCFHDAVTIHREVENTLHEIKDTIVLAGLIRLMRADYEQALAMIEEVERQSRTLGADIEIVLSLCEKGYILLAGNEPVDQILNQIDRISAESPHVHSECGSEIDRFRETVVRVAAGSRLFRGQLPEHIPSGVLQWLIRSGQYSTESFD